ncbi:rRNA-processing protein EBP2 [Elasticomyces elasticus]|nr:rRNA-processing protein EBP2 [Elasticomyces elasticus]
MPQKERKLKAALERSKGVNYDKERQKKLRKEAEKQKSKKQRSGINLNAHENATEVGDAEMSNGGDAEIAAKKWAALTGKAKGDVEGWETDEDDDVKLLGEDEEDEEDDDEAEVEGGVIIETFEDESESDSDEDQTFYTAAATSPQKVMTNDDAEEEGEDDDEEEEEIPLSDIESLASEDKGDVIPYQRLTINNTAALQRSLKSFALPDGLPFTATQAVSSAEPIEIADVEDDLNRELSFYQQSLHAVKEARIQLKKEGVPFSRPADYFAEMVKSEEQMGKVRQKMVDEAARKKASSDARRQRDLKKFGKAVQIAKLQERDRTKRDTLDKIGALKRKRAGGNDLTAKEDDMFDVALEDAATTEKGDRAARKSKAGRDGGSRRGGDDGPNRKRAKKDEKFGFGGKKRFSKSNDAKSTAESDGYNVKKMKGGKGAIRPGKSKRAKRV